MHSIFLPIKFNQKETIKYKTKNVKKNMFFLWNVFSLNENDLDFGCLVHFNFLIYLM